MNKLYVMDAEDCLNRLPENTFQTVYIDPPYNTQSKKFEYHDHYDDWEDFITSKIRKTRQVMQETGVLFVSIDDNKLIELRLICNEVFGKDNFLGMFITRQTTRSNAKHINTIHEYIIAYAKNKRKAPAFEIKRLEIPFYADKLLPLMAEIKKEHKQNGIASATQLLKKRLKEFEKIEYFSFLKNYSIVDENGEICFATDLSTPNGEPCELYIEEIMLHLPALKSRGWSSKEKFIKLFNENKLLFKQGRPYEKHLLSESKDNAMSILNFYSRQGKHDLERLDLGNVFSTAKPVEMIKYLIKISQISHNDKILDFFAGSGTTAQAVLECNQEDNGQREFVLCQVQEEIKNNLYAIEYLSGLGYQSNIAEIIKLRLARLQYFIQFTYEIE
ncbi:DNA methyltransferase [Simonsiella muelleri]|uniref:site-specific DNA-methyltransferase (adenine-specific) n=2 Tax=Simonsiella TaxID=71 RepID=V9HL46_9NEIS|nr:site-specific DNA-methyltransferase [Simonsiella muelleri ATCC 29453]EFG30886.1 hypothetical protein HMPREF9021_01114 [Simonsiella muelleri ATCC 29453]